MDKAGNTTIGYRYYMGLHMGIGRGPVDELVEVRVGDLTAWPLGQDIEVGEDPFGNPVYEHIDPPPPATGGTIQINAPELFGGDKSEGGIVGPLNVMMGEDTQPTNAALAGMLGGLVPAFRGVCSFFFDGQICAMNPYPKSWKFRVRRALKGWDGAVFYPQKAIIILCGDIYAMNPAHIIYETATNRDWGRGLSRDLLNTESFISAANTLAKECFGLCFTWSRSDDIQSFVQQVLDHIGATLYVDRGTGLLTLKLIRGDYDESALVVFDDNTGLLDIQEDDASSSDSLYNEVIVGWHDPIENEDHQMRVQNIAGMQVTGAISSKTISYPGIPTGDLAARVAQRDLGVYGLTLRRVKVKLDRRGWKVQPGMPFKIHSTLHGIDNMIVRAGRIEDNTSGDSTVLVTAVQDIFGMPETSYIEVQPPVNNNPSKEPVVTTIHRLMEIPYREYTRILSRADQATVTPDSGAIYALGVKPQPLALGFTLLSATGTEAYQESSGGDYAGSALISALDPDTTSASMTQGSDLSTVQIGTFALIDEECVVVTGIDLSTNVVTFGRGVMDTIPVKHDDGARIWFAQDYNGQDRREYGIGEVVRAKVLTKTTTKTLSPGLAAVDSLTIAGRYEMPYPPANVKVGGLQWFVENISVKGDIVFEWAHRDRLEQADQLVDYTGASIGPETGVTYNLRLYDAANTLLLNQTGITTAGFTVPEATDTVGLGATLRAEIEATRDGIISYQNYVIDFKHYLSTDAGWGLAYGESWGE